MRLANLTIPLFALVLAIGFSGCGTLNLIGHARIHNGGVIHPGPDVEYAVVVEVDGKPARSGPLPALEDSGAHPAAWVRAGRHLFRIGITSAAQRPGVINPTRYATFSATVQSETTYLLFVESGQPLLFEQKKGPGANSLPPLNQSFPLTIVTEP